uniref:Uncharacterized protein n=1 Tax=Dunaliella tertiolecta TaxID=3047 RepID=A0A7S3RAY3_DUNTE|mmetsp:Transcript_13106/g.35688  ORF Transcript_13106/g.35688 Transcript_13106/m.35688 type:complete len:134 (-) Transcript_13106:460-861(-)
MSFLKEYLGWKWSEGASDYDAKDLKAWNDYLQSAEKDRQRDRIISWRDFVTTDNATVSTEDPHYYRRTAGFVWRIKDESGKHKARNHSYLYNLELHGHKQYTRRDKKELEAMQQEVNARVATGQLGPLNPLEY